MAIDPRVDIGHVHRKVSDIDLALAAAGEGALATGTPEDRRGTEQTPETAAIGAREGTRGLASETADGDPASDN